MRFNNDISSTGSNLLVTITEVKQFVKPKDTNFEVSLSSFYTNIISYVSDSIENYCKKTLVAKDFTGYYNTSNCDTLYLDNTPINSVSSLKYRTDPTQPYSNNVITSSNQKILIYPNYIQIYNGYLNSGFKAIEIIYNAGLTTIPGDLKLVTLEMCQMIYNNSNRGNSFLGLKSISDSFNSNAGTMSFDYNSLKKEHFEILNGYKKFNI